VAERYGRIAASRIGSAVSGSGCAEPGFLSSDPFFCRSDFLAEFGLSDGDPYGFDSSEIAQSPQFGVLLV
jgi:hypothetical protein